MTTALGQGLDTKQVARHILSTCILHLDAAGAPAPARRSLVAGVPQETAWDCEQLTVGVAGVVSGQGETSFTGGFDPKVQAMLSATGVRHVIYIIQLIRCTPSTGPKGIPSAAQIDEAGGQAIRDIGLVSQAIHECLGTLRDAGLDPEGLCKPGDVVPVGPSGAFHGSEGTLLTTAMRLV